jgi:catechol 2,3-dioxygenase-like lactoylglutathione lyase family enzyme
MTDAEFRRGRAGRGVREVSTVTAMAIKNVSHVAVGVRDMDRSLPFWTDVVGLHVSLDTIEEFTIDGELIQRRGVYLREREGPDEPFVVLDEQLTKPKDGQPKPLFEIGVHHFGFWVDNIDEIRERARAADVPIVVEPSERGADTATYGEPSGGFVRSMFVRDPDGNFVQFDQRAG